MKSPLDVPFSPNQPLVVLLKFAALDTNPITNGDFEADLGSAVGSTAGNFNNTTSGWFGENGTSKGDFIQWD